MWYSSVRLNVVYTVEKEKLVRPEATAKYDEHLPPLWHALDDGPRSFAALDVCITMPAVTNMDRYRVKEDVNNHIDTS